MNAYVVKGKLSMLNAMVIVFSARFLNGEEESNVTPYVTELLGLIENIVDQEQREQANEAVYSLSLTLNRKDS